MPSLAAGANSGAGAAEPRRLADLMTPAAPLAPALVEHQVEAVAREVEALRDELATVRRRDDALYSYLRKMDEELRMAARLQQDFLPKAMPQDGRVRFHTYVARE